MIPRLPTALVLGLCLVLSGATAGIAAQPDVGPPPGGGPGGPGGPGGAERKILKQFDTDGNGVLNKAERDAARADMKANPQPGRRGPRGGPGGPGGGPGGGGRGGEPTSPGPKISPAEVRNDAEAPLYDPGVVRTLFFQFECDDWEAELAEFYNTDVEVPATLTVDGVAYPNVGVHFRGASSFFMVPAGGKRSLNVSMDMVDAKQALKGFRTLNLLNSHGDPSFMSTVLYSHLARPHIAAPRANFVRVVINGESWGTYVSVEQFNNDFVKEHFGSADGARWKVKGSPNGASGLDYIGDDLEAYKRRYQIKTKDRDEDWKDLANLCRVLSTTPLEELEEALKPILDIDGALWFLALDVAVVNSDGYWVRASDYSIYKDPKGVFHIVPHDMNEAFASGGGRGGPRGPGGPDGPGGPGGPNGPGGPEGAGRDGPRGGRPDGAGDAPAGEGARAEQPVDGQPARGPRGGGPGGGMMRRAGVDLDPLVGMEDERKPLRSRLLAVPSLRARYLEHVRELARDGMDWKKIGPVVARNRALLMEHVKADTRKASSLAAFEAATGDAAPEEGRPPTGLRGFFERRRAYLLEHAEIKKLDASAAAVEHGR